MLKIRELLKNLRNAITDKCKNCKVYKDPGIPVSTAYNVIRRFDKHTTAKKLYGRGRMRENRCAKSLKVGVNCEKYHVERPKTERVTWNRLESSVYMIIYNTWTHAINLNLFIFTVSFYWYIG